MREWAIAAALSGVLVAGSAHAQGILGEIVANKVMPYSAKVPPKSATGVAAAYFGVTVDPGDGGAVVAAVEPGSPAEAAGLRVGDLIEYVAARSITGDIFLIGDQDDVDGWLASAKPGAKWSFLGYRGRKVFHGNFVLAPPRPGVGPRASPMTTTQATDGARAAYVQMCAKGQERLSAATCESMRRDLEKASAAQALAKREAEVMGVYRRLCSPGAEKLSKTTCAQMLTDAGGGRK